MTLFNRITTKDEDTEILLANIIYGENILKITEVLEATEESRRQDLIEGHSSIVSGAEIYVAKSEHSCWVYIPYCSSTQSPNFSLSNLRDTNISTLKKIYDRYTGQDLYFALFEFVKRCRIVEIKRIYKMLYGGIHNSQSMAVFSGLLKESRNNIEVRDNLLYPPCYYLQCRHIKNDYTYHIKCRNGNVCNFLYLGDYEAKKNQSFSALKTFYAHCKVWDTISGIQIPHHGSRDNYHVGLYDNKCFAIASAGIRNKYGHPHIDTLMNIANQGCFPIVVTDDINSLKYQYFKIQ